MRKQLTFLIAGVLALGACQNTDVPFPNQPTLTSLTGAPTPASVGVAAQGMIVGEDQTETGFATSTGTIAREFLPLNSQEPRPYNEALNGPVNNASQGGGNWAGYYTNIRQGWIILHALDQLGTSMSDADKSAIKGFTLIWMANNLRQVIDSHDINGAVIDTDRDPFGDPGALATYTDAVTYDLKQFDDGIAALQKGGATFPFKFNSGWTGFNTPATFLTVAHALKGRAALHFKQYAVALTETNASFINTNSSLDLGPTLIFSAAAGETKNPIFNSQINYAHTFIVTSAELKPGATITVCNIDSTTQCDDRVARNVTKTTGKTYLQSFSNLVFTKYASSNASFPVIRNEELILNRAETRFQTGDIAGAISDVNLIRTKSGGLPARADLNATNLLSEILKQRFFSLWLEGDRWVALRRYNKLGDTTLLPKDVPTHIVWTKYPVPNSECLPRGSATCFATGGSAIDVVQ
jgi:starch-binding outer membrane protein, SusD/RagB family